jgi:hypothetical protein
VNSNPCLAKKCAILNKSKARLCRYALAILTVHKDTGGLLLSEGLLFLGIQVVAHAIAGTAVENAVDDVSQCNQVLSIQASDTIQNSSQSTKAGHIIIIIKARHSIRPLFLVIICK